MTCNESGGGVGNKSGQSTLQLPTIEMLPMPAQSDRCIVSANAQLHDSGNLTISLYNGNAPAVSVASPSTSAATTTTGSTAAPSTSSVNATGTAPNENVGPTPERVQSCGGSVSTGPDTSCGFAQNVFSVVTSSYRQTGTIPANVMAFSPATRRDFSAGCAVVGYGSEVTCDTPTGGSVTIEMQAIKSGQPATSGGSFSPTPAEVAKAKEAYPLCKREQPSITLQQLEQEARTPTGIQC